MANRFTETEKWRDNWYMKLKPRHKIFWIYLLDTCDHAGIWEPNIELANFQIGFKYAEKELLEILKERVCEINGKWFIPKFIEFQYKCTVDQLNIQNKAHLGIINALKKHGIDEGALKGLQRGCEAPKEQDKEQDKEQERQGIVKGISFFEEIWKKYPNKDGKKEAERHFKATVKSDKDLKDINIALENYLKSERVLKGFVKNGSTWFNNWRDWIDVFDAKKIFEEQKEKEFMRKLEAL